MPSKKRPGPAAAAAAAAAASDGADASAAAASACKQPRTAAAAHASSLTAGAVVRHTGSFALLGPDETFSVLQFLYPRELMGLARVSRAMHRDATHPRAWKRVPVVRFHEKPPIGHSIRQLAPVDTRGFRRFAPEEWDQFGRLHTLELQVCTRGHRGVALPLESWQKLFDPRGPAASLQRVLLEIIWCDGQTWDVVSLIARFPRLLAFEVDVRYATTVDLDVLKGTQRQPEFTQTWREIGASMGERVQVLRLPFLDDHTCVLQHARPLRLDLRCDQLACIDPIGAPDGLASLQHLVLGGAHWVGEQIAVMRRVLNAMTGLRTLWYGLVEQNPDRECEPASLVAVELLRDFPRPLRVGWSSRASDHAPAVGQLLGAAPTVHLTWFVPDTARSADPEKHIWAADLIQLCELQRSGRLSMIEWDAGEEHSTYLRFPSAHGWGLRPAADVLDSSCERAPQCQCSRELIRDWPPHAPFDILEFVQQAGSTA